MARELLLPWDSQPQGPIELDRSNYLTRNITYLLPLNGDDREIVKGGRLTLGTGGSFDVDSFGVSLRGNGSQACASIPIDLSAYTKLSLSFWLYWPAFANDDKLCMELSTNTNTTNGAFLIDPNDITGTFILYNRVTSNSGGKLMSVTRPTSGSWHHYCWIVDRAASKGQGHGLYIDGILQSNLPHVSDKSGDGTAFANSTLYIASRAGTSLFGSGRLANLVIRGGYMMQAHEVRSEYANPWQLFKPRQIPAVYSSGIPVLSLVGATDITTISLRVQVIVTY